MEFTLLISVLILVGVSYLIVVEMIFVDFHKVTVLQDGVNIINGLQLHQKHVLQDGVVNVLREVIAGVVPIGKPVLILMPINAMILSVEII